ANPRHAGSPPRKIRTCRSLDFQIKHWLSPTDGEDVAEEGVGGAGEIDTHDRHSRMRRFNGDHGLIKLEITILVIAKGGAVGTDIGSTDRPAEDRLRMPAPRAIAPVKTVEAEILCASVGKVNGAAAHGRRRAVTGRGEDIQRAIGRGGREG